MISDQFQSFVFTTLEFMVALFVFMIGVAVIVVIIVYILDVSQTKQAIRRNYPVVGHFRYFFEKLGGFFRQYFFAMDREEMPFNRAQRSWVYRAAKDLDNTIAFGSTRDLRPPGTVLFVNCPFPTLGEDMVAPEKVTVGPGCRKPYSTSSFFNISAMSFGAISTPALLALSNGARMARCWLNTGEGGLSPYHLEGGADLVFQMGTAKYGVRDQKGKLSDDRLREIAGYDQVKMFEIKLSQGAKPGKGGILPGGKVTEEIARIRGIPPGKDSISPNRHYDIANMDQLLDKVAYLRDLTGRPVGVKTAVGGWEFINDLCDTVLRRGKEYAPDFLQIDGG